MVSVVWPFCYRSGAAHSEWEGPDADELFEPSYTVVNRWWQIHPDAEEPPRDHFEDDARVALRIHISKI